MRNLGTIGGSLANNDPSACYPAAALGSGATIVTNAREIAADDFFQGMFTTALEPGEIITEVRFPVPERAHYEKFLQPASRFALVAVFVAKYPDGVRVAVTGASESGRLPLDRGRGGARRPTSAPAAVKALKASADGHDRRPARHAGVPRPPDRRADRAARSPPHPDHRRGRPAAKP